MCTVNILRLPSTPGLHLAVGVYHVYAGVEGYRVVAGAAVYVVYFPVDRLDGVSVGAAEDEFHLSWEAVVGVYLVVTAVPLGTVAATQALDHIFAPTQRAAKLTVQSTLMAKATPAPKANNIMLPASAASAAKTFR
jgi:hypothetical protein